MANVLFLDYDGVLHPDEVRLAGGYNEIKRPVLNWEGLELFCWAPILEEILAPHPEVRIVLSTKWGHHFGVEVAAQYLSPDLRARVVGGTDRQSAIGLPRGEQIALHAAANGIAHWVALDDDDYNWPAAYRDRFICTDPWLGLSEQAVQDRLRDMLRLLGKA